jgi:polysaccharide deacetylase family protein (PEP-CTERM system associated)
MINLLTIDVEDFPSLFARDYLSQAIPVSGRVVENTRRMLDLIEGAGVRATCFCLGQVAAAYPDLVREIARRGFEVASHGMNHLLFSRLDLAAIRKDLAEAKARLEDVAGVKVRGFRAPVFNVSLSRPEVITALIETGHEYDSSIFPVAGRRYGSPESPRGPYRIVMPEGSIVEFPLATVEVPGRRLPAAGGGYLRHFPYFINRLAIRRINGEGLPVTVYLHPYECDTDEPKYSAGHLPARARLKAFLARASQTHGRNGTMTKIAALLGDFSFAKMGETLDRTTSLPEFDISSVPSK